jgi:hypothetical protein
MAADTKISLSPDPAQQTPADVTSVARIKKIEPIDLPSIANSSMQFG